MGKGIDDGIELLTGIPAGQRDDQGLFPDDSVNRRVEDTLTRYAETMQAYASKGGREDSTQMQAPS